MSEQPKQSEPAKNAAYDEEERFLECFRVLDQRDRELVVRLTSQLGAGHSIS